MARVASNRAVPPDAFEVATARDSDWGEPGEQRGGELRATAAPPPR